MCAEFVKLQEKKMGKGTVYMVTVPKRFVEQLGWKKGHYLKVYVRELEGKKVLVYEWVE